MQPVRSVSFLRLISLLPDTILRSTPLFPMDATTIDWIHWDSIYPFSPGPLLIRILPKFASFKGVGLLIAVRVPGSVVPSALELRCRGHFRLPFPVLTQEQKKEWLPMVRITDCSSMLGSFSPSRRCSPFRLGICPVSQRKPGVLRKLILYLLY